MSLTFQQNLTQMYPERFRVEDSRLGLHRAYDTVLRASLTWHPQNTSTLIRSRHKNNSIQTPPSAQGLNLSDIIAGRTRENLGGVNIHDRVRRSAGDDPSYTIPESRVVRDTSVEERLASAFHGLSLFIVVVLLTEVMTCIWRYFAL